MASKKREGRKKGPGDYMNQYVKDWASRLKNHFKGSDGRLTKPYKRSMEGKKKNPKSYGK